MAKTLGLKDWSSVTPQVLTGAIQAMIAAGGFASYQIAVIVANAVWKALFGAGLSFATNANITRALSIFAGPIGWIITGLWTIVDIAGPATRVTIPAAFLIALLKEKLKPATTAPVILLRLRKFRHHIMMAAGPKMCSIMMMTEPDGNQLKLK